MKTEIINAPQGSEAWHQHRSTHYNASDLAAAMGLSPYKTRNDLIREKATGLSKEVDEATLRRFAKGHEYEATARPWAEEIIGSDLFPVVLAAEIDGLKLSASMDGLTMINKDISWEHKWGNAALLESLERGVIPAEYHPQLEQGLMLSAAGRCLFMASCGERATMRSAWYESSPELRAKIIPTWKQLADDVSAYRHVEVLPATVAAPITALPSVSVQVTGSIAVRDNFAIFETALRDFIENRLIREPETDQDFADLDLQIKALKNAETALDAAEAQMLAQVDGVDAVKRMKEMLHKLARDNRLMAEKLLASRKEAIRGELLAEGRDAYDKHVRALNNRLGKPYLSTATRSIPDADFVGAIKGKRMVDSLRDAVNTTLANAKIAASAIADNIQVNLGTLHELAAAHAFLFADTAQIVLKQPDDFTALVKTRIAEHQAAELAKEEATRERIRVEEQQKAEAAVREAERVKAEEVARLAREAAWIPGTKADPNPQPLSVGQQEILDAIPFTPRAARATPPTLKLGEIGTRLGFSLTGDFLKSLGFEPAARDKSALLFHEADFENICDSLTYHINDVKQKINRETA